MLRPVYSCRPVLYHAQLSSNLPTIVLLQRRFFKAGQKGTGSQYPRFRTTPSQTKSPREISDEMKKRKNVRRNIPVEEKSWADEAAPDEDPDMSPFDDQPKGVKEELRRLKEVGVVPEQFSPPQF